MSVFLEDTTLPAIVAGVLAIVAALMALPRARWEARFERDANEYELVEELVEDHYNSSRREWRCLYKLRDDLCIGQPELKGRARRLSTRAERVDALDPQRRTLGLKAAQLWASSVGQLAETASTQGLRLRRFLQTYHLTLIREGALAEAFLVWSDPRDDPSLDDHAAWAFALRDLALAYNALAPHQREPVTFLSSPGEDALLIVDSPPHPHLRFLNTRNRLSRGLRLRRWRVHVAASRLHTSCTAYQRADTASHRGMQGPSSPIDSPL